ncbi:plastocyanin/azurin family copper-binding protein [Longimicrobium sp.]|jgi:plastocyanin|uniref:plastocyanin/azurin family copper-binding protein n=1 Tax=Longimicrobium sp. TaxID=2029185 RepID=UPI002F9564DD
MIGRAIYSFTCAAFAFTVAAGALAGCFSERVAGPAMDENLCEGSPANVVQIRNFAFAQSQITVTPGTTVTWVNCDQEIHTSTSDGGVWASGQLSPTAIYTRTFAAAGTFPYHCDPHPSMKGTVVVR